jgi:hypothetical protein
MTTSVYLLQEEVDDEMCMCSCSYTQYHTDMAEIYMDLTQYRIGAVPLAESMITK